MPWNVLPTFTDGVSVATAADLNKYRENMEWLHNPPKASYEYSGSNLTTTATTWASIGASWELTITTAGGDVLVVFSATVTNMDFDIDFDGTKWTAGTSTATGALEVTQTVNKVMIYLPMVRTGLSAGSHTVKAMWKVPSVGTATIYGTYAPRFYVRELK